MTRDSHHLWAIASVAAGLAFGVVFLLKRSLEETRPAPVRVGSQVAATNRAQQVPLSRGDVPAPATSGRLQARSNEKIAGDRQTAPVLPPPSVVAPDPDGGALPGPLPPLTPEMERTAKHFVSTDEKGASERLAELQSLGVRATQGDSDALQTLLAVAQSQICLSGDAVTMLGKVDKSEASEAVLRLTLAPDPIRSVAAIQAQATQPDKTRVLKAISKVLRAAAAGHFMAPDRVRTASVGVLSGIRSPECVRLVVRELDSLPVDVSHLEYGSRLVGLARSFGEEAARTALAGYAERLKAARPADPVSGGYFDQKIAEVRKAVESVEEAGPRM